jgi:hypothetical protein
VIPWQNQPLLCWRDRALRRSSLGEIKGRIRRRWALVRTALGELEAAF